MSATYHVLIVSGATVRTYKVTGTKPSYKVMRWAALIYEVSDEHPAPKILKDRFGVESPIPSSWEEIEEWIDSYKRAWGE